MVGPTTVVVGVTNILGLRYAHAQESNPQAHASASQTHEAGHDDGIHAPQM
jgi:hypothetical protein